MGKKGRVQKTLLLLTALSLVFCFGWVAGYEGYAPAREVFGAAQEDAVAAFRTERQQLRAMQRAQLADIIHDSETDREIVGMAQRQLIQITSAEEAENTLEGILKMRGYEDCVVTVGDDSVNVLVRTEMITQQDSSVILELVCRETGVQSGNVKIIPIN